MDGGGSRCPRPDEKAGVAGGVCVATAMLGVREITPDTTVFSWEQSATV